MKCLRHRSMRTLASSSVGELVAGGDRADLRDLIGPQVKDLVVVERDEFLSLPGGRVGHRALQRVDDACLVPGERAENDLLDQIERGEVGLGNYHRKNGEC